MEENKRQLNLGKTIQPIFEEALMGRTNMNI